MVYRGRHGGAACNREDAMSGESFIVRNIEELRAAPEEYRVACEKIVISHAINELHGVRVYDEPAIGLAPTVYAKWLTLRVVMEEYGHHVRFFELGRKMGIEERRMMAGVTEKAPLSIFGYPMKTWTEFVAIKLLGDMAEILQVEDLIQSTCHPIRELARMTLPEEKFHAQFGVDFGKELCRSPKGRSELQAAINGVFPMMPAFFGRSGSRNNEIYRKWGLKLRTNEQMREDYISRARRTVESLGLSAPELATVDA
jgi:ring-1,2-phenylacetyl-CoA epoxidase subunit PaaA